MIENTDKEVWRAPTDGDPFYADSVFITKDNAIGINVGGTVIVRKAREWHILAWPSERVRRTPRPSKLAEAVLDLMYVMEEL